MSSQSKSKELIVSTKAKEKLPVKYNESSVLDLVDNEIFLENRNEVKKYLPEILGRVLARIWIDENFKDTFKNTSQPTVKDPQWEALYSGIEGSSFTTPDSSNQQLLDVPETPKVFQLFSKYIVCPLKTQLLLIDQKRAHQRILYERFLSSITQKKGVSQSLLFPVIVALNPKQAEEYDHNADTLELMGFRMTLNPDSKLTIIGAPEYCPASKVESLIELLLAHDSNKSSLEDFSPADRVAKTMAKSLAIQSGEPMNTSEQQALVDDFFACKETAVSPFNRQIFITLEKAELEQKLN